MHVDLTQFQMHTCARPSGIQRNNDQNEKKTTKIYQQNSSHSSNKEKLTKIVRFHIKKKKKKQLHANAKLNCLFLNGNCRSLTALFKEARTKPMFG